MKIDIYQLESLANEICEEQSTAKEKLARLIRAFARIINAKSPEKFGRRALAFGDEAGHCDNSFPPEQEFTNFTGPRALSIIGRSTEDVPTESGFYYDYKTVTTDGGLWVTPEGDFLESDLHGTGHFGQFAAHPGDCHVESEIDWNDLALDDVPLDRLVKAEKELRDLAFPLVAARLAAKETQPAD